MTFLAFGWKCPPRGANGFAGSILTVGGEGAFAPTPSAASSALRAIAPTPTPHWPKKWRRVEDFRFSISDLGLSGITIFSLAGSKPAPGEARSIFQRQLPAEERH